MPPRMQNPRRKPPPAHRVTPFHEILNARHRRRRHPKPLRLCIQMFVQLHVRLMNHHRRASRPMQLRQPAHMINMRVRAHDGPQLEPMPLQNLENPPNIIARIHNNRFVRNRIAQNRTVALQHPHRNHFMDQFVAHNFHSIPVKLSADSVLPSLLSVFVAAMSLFFLSVTMKLRWKRRLQNSNAPKAPSSPTSLAAPSPKSSPISTRNTAPVANPSPSLTLTGTPPSLSPAL